MHDQQLRTDHELAAYQMGVQAALNAASWIIDGNTAPSWMGVVLGLMEEGCPTVEDYLPAYPNLSGEWADDPTPTSLYGEIIGYNDGGGTDGDAEGIAALCDAWEEGVSDTFYSECGRILRAALED